MKVTLLGTGDAVGTPKLGCSCPTCLDALAGGKSRRLRFSVLVESETGRLLIDTSPDLRWQLLKKSISHVTGVNIEIEQANNIAYFFDGTNTVPKYNVYGLRRT